MAKIFANLIRLDIVNQPSADRPPSLRIPGNPNKEREKVCGSRIRLDSDLRHREAFFTSPSEDFEGIH